MNLKIKFFIFLIIFNFYADISLSIENKILFKINNKIITSIDLLNEINYLKATNSEFSNTDDKLSFEIAKNSIIREKIKEIELINLIKKIEIEESLLKKILENNFKYLNINTEEDFNKFFISRNIKPSYVKKKISIELLWNQLIFTKFKNKVKINLDQLRNDLMNEKQTELLLSEIFFELEKGEKLEEKYTLIKKTINEKSFGQAALIHSVSDSSKNGGKIGWVKLTAINKKILNEIKQIDINEYTKPIIVPGGFLILKVKDKREKIANIDVEKELKIVVEKAQNQQLSQYSNIYLNKVKKNISIDEL